MNSILKKLRAFKNLLISFLKPHKRITTSTTCRWFVKVLKNAGMDITLFGSHSTRSASTAICKKKGLSMKERNIAAGWSFSRTLSRHYNKSIVDESGSFSMTVLESQSCKYIYKSCNFYQIHWCYCMHIRFVLLKNMLFLLSFLLYNPI